MKQKVKDGDVDYFAKLAGAEPFSEPKPTVVIKDTTHEADEVVNAYRAGVAAAKQAWSDTLYSTPSVNETLRGIATQRKHCYGCSPGDAYEDGPEAGKNCTDETHAVYSLGYLAGIAETLTDRCG